jgi:acetyl-CoA synthetase
MTEETPDSSLTPAWTPSREQVAGTNAAWLMRQVEANSPEALHRWSVENREAYWAHVIQRLNIRFQRPFSRVLDAAAGGASPRWLPGAALNIVESCFAAPPDSPAIVFQAEGGPLQTMTVSELRTLAGRVAAGLTARGCRPGDALAMVMPMTAEAVAIYLGIIQAGCVAVGIADSFQPKEIAVRLRLAGAVGVFTQDVLPRGGRTLPLYARVLAADAPPAIVLAAAGDEPALPLRAGDIRWSDFLPAIPLLQAAERAPSDALNILFSSGTTGEPKAIPWTQTTPLKCAADAHFHQDVRPGDVLVWPTNLGWMMGPWLVFASLLNRASMGLYYGASTGPEFGAFVQAAGTTLLGVIPSLVKTWRRDDVPRGVDWSGLRAFTSTGECSSATDMRWLMEQAGGRPVIEYCGGTEIGGGYITGTMTRPCIPGTFNTPALGSDFVILNEAGLPANRGELFLIPPSIGLSDRLLQRDHDEVYFAGTPTGPGGEKLRRHGDEMETAAPGYWRGLGRADDTMNLGGIKVSSGEIERVLQTVPGIVETAAIGVSPGGGPSQLVVYAVSSLPRSGPEHAALLGAMQAAIKGDLNPLFKIHELVLIGDPLPRTASHKVLRRELRARYLAGK